MLFLQAHWFLPPMQLQAQLLDLQQLERLPVPPHMAGGLNKQLPPVQQLQLDTIRMRIRHLIHQFTNTKSIP